MAIETDKINLFLADIRKRIKDLEDAGPSDQLAHSSVDIASTRGYIPFVDSRDGNTEKFRIGRQPDGTVMAISKNNVTEPIIPNYPECTSFIGGVNVKCTGFQSTQYLDFSHVNVYCDDAVVGTIIKVPGSFPVGPLSATAHNFSLSSVNLSGTESPRSSTVVATPNLVVGTDVTDGIIDTLKLANNAVTEAKVNAGAITNTKIGDNSIDSYKIAAYAIQAINLAASSISSDKIAANAITADKIQALAIAADKIAANAITSGKIQAGSVTAEKFAGQILMATIAFICGDPVGQRLVIDSTGITQYNPAGNLLLQIGASANGNTFTVVDSAGNTLATLDSKGVLAASGISVNDPARNNFTINGDSFYGFVDSLPRGAIGFVTLTGFTSVSTASETGLVEMSVEIKPNRTYKLSTNTVVSNTTSLTGLTVRLTDGSTRPLTTSPLFETSGYVNYGGGALSVSTLFNSSPTDSKIGILLGLVSPNGTTATIVPQGGSGLRMWLEDIGAVNATGGNANGSGGSTVPQNYTKTYTAIWNRAFQYSGGSIFGADDNNIQQGYYDANTNYVSMLGFDSTQIVSDLTGATITSVQLFVANGSTAAPEGAYLAMGIHGYSSAPYPYPSPGNAYGLAEYTFTRGQSKWMDIPSSGTRNGATTNIWALLKAGTAKGFLLDASYKGVNAQYRANFYPISGGAGRAPQLRITYSK